MSFVCSSMSRLLPRYSELRPSVSEDDIHHVGGRPYRGVLVFHVAIAIAAAQRPPLRYLPAYSGFDSVVAAVAAGNDVAHIPALVNRCVDRRAHGRRPLLAPDNPQAVGLDEGSHAAGIEVPAEPAA